MTTNISSDKQGSSLRHRIHVKSSNATVTTTIQQKDDSAIAQIHPSPPLIFNISTFFFVSLLVLVPVRLFHALSLRILFDCDETFNYWEPLHYLLYGRGMQTWEYSRVFGLRSYFYLWIISPAAWIANILHSLYLSFIVGIPASELAHQQELDKLLLFYLIRISFALMSCFVEIKLLCTIRRLYGPSLAHWCLFFLAIATGMSHATIAFLPQTFTMFFVILTLDAWMNKKYNYVIFYTGVCCLIGWPFSFLLSLPVALEILYVYRGSKLIKPIYWGFVTAGICLVPSFIMDYLYYGKFIFAILNIAMYNSNAAAADGANLYGIEPPSYYFMNLFLNFNIGSLLAYATPIVLIVVGLVRLCTRNTSSSSSSSAPLPLLSLFRYYLPFYLWFIIFLIMPHKEERFLFVIYPYLCFAAAISCHFICELLSGLPSAASPSSSSSSSAAASSSPSSFRTMLSKLFAFSVIVIFTSLCASRTISLHLNYSAPLKVWTELHDRAIGGLKDLNAFPFPYSVEGSERQSIPQQEGEQVDMYRTNLDMQRPPHDNINVCVGKEWYRFPNHFFLPTLSKLPHSDASPYTLNRPLVYRLRFLDSDFNGLLPKDYAEQWQLHSDVSSFPSNNHALARSSFFKSFFNHYYTRPGTWLTPTGMNGLNKKEDTGRFIKNITECHYIIDLELDENEQKEIKYAGLQVKLENNNKPEEICPVYIKDKSACPKGYSFEVVYEASLLVPTSSSSSSSSSSSEQSILHRISGAFYVPFGYSTQANARFMKSYQLIQRMPIHE